MCIRDRVVDADDAPQKVAQVVQEQLQTTLPGFTLELKVEPKKQRVQDMQDEMCIRDRDNGDHARFEHQQKQRDDHQTGDAVGNFQETLHRCV